MRFNLGFGCLLLFIFLVDFGLHEEVCDLGALLLYNYFVFAVLGPKVSFSYL